jgi:hypothetical protein
VVSSEGNYEWEGNALLDVDLVLQVGEVGSEELLCLRAIWAVTLGEYDNLVASDGIFDGLLSRHACSRRGGEERPNRPAKYTIEHGTLSKHVRGSLFDL